jgi:hypothetical protein
MIGKPLELISYLYNADKEKQYELREYHKRKTLSQNAYAWVLINEIANKINKSKEQVYLQMLKDYGQRTEILLKADVKVKTYFKYYEAINKIKKNDIEFIEYYLYKGSSQFDSKEMSIFIDGIIEEAKQLGIQTMTPNEIRKLEII